MFFTPKKRIVATIGYPGHGKSVFLASLYLDSFYRLSESFEDKDEHKNYTLRAATEAAMNVFQRNGRRLYEQLELPPANPRSKPEPAIL